MVMLTMLNIQSYFHSLYEINKRSTGQFVHEEDINSIRKNQSKIKKRASKNGGYDSNLIECYTSKFQQKTINSTEQKQNNKLTGIKFDLNHNNTRSSKKERTKFVFLTSATGLSFQSLFMDNIFEHLTDSFPKDSRNF